MSLDDFKFIFYFEYGHRMLGRFIGLSFALPFLYFVSKRAIPKSLLPRLVVFLFCLGGADGLIGWWMVKSGLIDRPDVSHLPSYSAFKYGFHALSRFALDGT